MNCESEIMFGIEVVLLVFLDMLSYMNIRKTPWTTLKRCAKKSNWFMIYRQWSYMATILETYKQQNTSHYENIARLRLAAIAIQRHCIIFIVFYALYYIHCILCIVYTVYFMHFIWCIVFYSLDSMHCILCFVF